MIAASHFRSYVERQTVLPQDDGSYLVRPYLRRRLVYRTDKTTKERFVAFRSRIEFVAAILTALLLLSTFAGFARIPHVTPLLDYWFLPAVLALFVCLIPCVIAARIWERRLLSSGTRVSAQLWAGRHPMAVWPFWLRMVWLAVVVGGGIWGIVLFGRYGFSPWVFAAALGLFFVLVFVRRRELFGRSSDTPRGP